MKKRYVSLTLVIIFTIILFYFLSTKTSLQLFVKTTKADGQSTKYGVDVINFNRPIGIKECDSTNPSASGNVILKYTDKPYPNPDADHQNPAEGSPSLFASKDNGANWTNLLAGGGGGIPQKIVKYESAGNYTYTPTSGTSGLYVVVVGGGGPYQGEWGSTGGGAAIGFIKDVPSSVSVTVGGPAGDSNFGSFLTAKGGQPGAGINGGIGILGTGLVGGFVSRGGNGWNLEHTGACGGAGFGLSTVQFSQGGRDPIFPGGGGAGGVGGDGKNGSGANGCVWIYEY